MNMKISKAFTQLENTPHQTNQAKRKKASDTMNKVKKMVQEVNVSANQDEVKVSSKKAQEMSNALLEQETASIQSDVSESSSIEEKIDEKQRELLEAIAAGDYDKIKSLASDLKTLVQQLQLSASSTGSKYQNVDVPNIPNVSGMQSQSNNASAKASASAQQVASAQAQVNKGANALKGTNVAQSVQAKAQASQVQASNVDKLAKLKSTANVDKKSALKSKEVLHKAEARKTTEIEAKAQRLAENKANPKANNQDKGSTGKATTQPANQDNDSQKTVDSQENSNDNSTKKSSNNNPQSRASNAYAKTQNDQRQQKDTRVSLDDIKANPEKYASKDVLKSYTEELSTAKSMSGPSMDNYIAITEKVLAKAEKAMKLAKEIGATDGSTESNSRLADAVSDEGIVGSGDVPQAVLEQHRMLSQQHKLEKAQKEMAKQAQSNNSDSVDTDADKKDKPSYELQA